MRLTRHARVVLAAADFAGLLPQAATGEAARPPLAGPATAALGPSTSERCSRAVARICRGALLFEHAHAVVTCTGG